MFQVLVSHMTHHTGAVIITFTSAPCWQPSTSAAGTWAAHCAAQAASPGGKHTCSWAAHCAAQAHLCSSTRCARGRLLARLLVLCGEEAGICMLAQASRILHHEHGGGHRPQGWGCG